MDRIDIVKQYYQSLVARDGEAVSQLFVEHGAIEDGRGDRHVGRDGIAKFVYGLADNGLRVDAPKQSFEEGSWFISQGLIFSDADAQGRKMRWVFHFEGEQIGRLINSFVENF